MCMEFILISIFCCFNSIDMIANYDSRPHLVCKRETDPKRGRDQNKSVEDISSQLKRRPVDLVILTAA